MPSLFESAMGEQFGQLDCAVQRFHRLAGRHSLSGEVRTHAPSSGPAWLIALCLGTPRLATHGALRFELDATPEIEIWTRHFPRQTMRSQLLAARDGVSEALGPVRLRFALSAHDGTLEMRLTRVSLWRVSCPRWLMPSILARESGGPNRLQFAVEVRLPLLGLVARYDGHLAIPGLTPP